MFDGWNFLLTTLARVINPPPLTSLSGGQKIARILLVALTLIGLCIAAAIVGTLALFVTGQARALANDQTFVAGTTIVLLAVLIDTVCLRVILAIKRAP